MENGKLAMSARYLLGVAVAFFGLNGFFQFVTPPALSARAGDFFAAMVNTGYLFQLINIILIVSAVMLLTNQYVPLALTIMFPVMLNVVLFHIFLDVSSGAGGFIVFILNIYLIAVYRDNFESLFER